MIQNRRLYNTLLIVSVILGVLMADVIWSWSVVEVFQISRPYNLLFGYLGGLLIGVIGVIVVVRYYRD